MSRVIEEVNLWEREGKTVYIKLINWPMRCAESVLKFYDSQSMS